MLINTVILFLRDLLPLFILGCYLSSLKPYQLSRSSLIKVLITTLVFVLLLLTTARYTSEWFDGLGTEFIQIGLVILSYLGLVIVGIFSSNKPSVSRDWLLFVSIALICSANLKSFLIYVEVYIASQVSLSQLLAGGFIGLAICISFSVIFRFLLLEFKRRDQTAWIKVGWNLFLAGQVSQMTFLLSQVDILESTEALYDSSRWITDESEYGHLLNALFGYEASPSLAYILVFLFSFFLPFILPQLKRLVIERGSLK